MPQDRNENDELDVRDVKQPLPTSISDARAVPPDEAYKFRSATWNMQGSGSSSGDSNWARVINMLQLSTNSNSALDIITLQESGALPDSTTDTPEEQNETLVVTELSPSGPQYLAIIIIFLMFSISSARAVPPDEAYKFRSATWNMQGSGSSGGDSNWARVINMLQLSTNSNSALDIITLQESGALPDSTTDTPEEQNETLVVTELLPSGLQSRRYPGDIHEVQWNIGSSTRPNTFYIYQLEMADSRGPNRLSMAIVSRYRADEIYVLPAASAKNSTRRPILGIRIGNSAFFNIHAAAIGGGNEAPAQVIAIENAMLNHISGVSSWMILGDYNRSPNSLIHSSEFQNNPARHPDIRQIIYDRSGRATQQSGNILDYAILGLRNRFPDRIVLIQASILNNIRSDHSAVRFSPCS